MPVSRKRLNQKGFTLVELLIVVAIIGVLSTIGVPTFRKMIQKAKKSEAKVNLGGLYTSEQAFFSEYGVYGNNLNAIGFETDGQSPIYTIGFLTNACVSQTILPLVASGPQSAALYTAYGGYPAAFTARAGNGVLAGTACTPTNLADANVGYGADAVPNIYSSAGGEMDRFVAGAWGLIRPGILPANATAAQVDYWAINQGRRLSNLRDGLN